MLYEKYKILETNTAITLSAAKTVGYLQICAKIDILSKMSSCVWLKLHFYEEG